MIGYMGSKSKYAPRISGFMWRYVSRNHLPVFDACCGSAAMAFYWGRPVTLVDAGPWGTFWNLVSQHKLKDFNFTFTKPMESYVYAWKNEMVPSRDDPMYAVRFLLLQMAAFNGKPVGDNLGMWQHPGVNPKACSKKKWEQTWFLVKQLKRSIVEAVREDVHKYDFPPSNIYIDPDYEDTTGYDYTVKVGEFLEDNQDSNIFVSHHKEFPGLSWDYVYDITHGTRAFSISNKEYLFVKHRKDFGS